LAGTSQRDTLSLEAAKSRLWLKSKGSPTPLGADALAGAHGRNAEEFIYRVRDGGDRPMDALLSGASVAAESLGMADRIGSLAVGKEADIVAVDGNPLDDITPGPWRSLSFLRKTQTFSEQTLASRRILNNEEASHVL